MHDAATLPPGLRWDTTRERLKITDPRLANIALHDPHIVTGIDHGRDPQPAASPDEGQVPSVAQFFQLWYTVGADYPRFNTELRKAFTVTVAHRFDMLFNARAHDQVRALPPHGDLAAAYFLPYFLHSTFEMLGVPEADWPNLAKVAQLVVHLFKQQLLGNQPSPREQQAFATVTRYLYTLTNQLLAADVETPFLSAARLLRRDAPNSWPIAALIGQLLMAGIEPMVAGATETTLLIWRDPRLADQARAGTAADIGDIAEDAMRRQPPFAHIFRFVAQPCDCLGLRLEPGTVLAVEIAPVNLAFEPQPGCPVKAGSVWTFGKGTHYCLGANTARLQVAAAIRQLATAHPRIELGEPARVDTGNNLRQVISLPYRIEQQ